MKIKIYSKKTLLALLSLTALTLTSCNSTLDADPPTDQIEIETAFQSKSGIEIAHRGLYVYNFLQSDTRFRYMNIFVPTYCSMFSDDMIHRTADDYEEYYSNQYDEQNSYIATLWSDTYKRIRMSTVFIENMENNTILNSETHNVLVADALFLRAFNYFFLTNLFGDVPLVLTTKDDDASAQLPRAPQSDVYAQIESDLLEAVEKFADSNRGVQYFSANACYALLARVYTYTEKWDKAAECANKLIPTADGGQGTIYSLDDIDNVYKASSKEAIFSANVKNYTAGDYIGFTVEGYQFIPTGSNVNFQLTTNIVSLLQAEPDDKRNNWIAEVKGVYYPYKYKNLSTPTKTSDYEYQNWFRLTEDYLIRAEALAHQGDLTGAIADVNKIRERAGISVLDATDMQLEEVIDAIMEERHKEFFCEGGHRFFDLRRTGKIDEVLGACDWKTWSNYHKWLPIPVDELLYNHNLTKNEGYGD